jgi:hypothetical protein
MSRRRPRSRQAPAARRARGLATAGAVLAAGGMLVGAGPASPPAPAAATGGSPMPFAFPPTRVGGYGSVSPATVGVPRLRTPVTAMIATTLTPTPFRAIPATPATIGLSLPAGAALNGRLFPSCSQQVLDAHNGDPRACPPGSRVGRGAAVGYVAGLVEPLRIDLFNTDRGRALLLSFRGDHPVLIRSTIRAPLRRLPPSNRFEHRLDLRVPRELQQPIPETFGSVRLAVAVLDGRRTIRRGTRTIRRGYVELALCPLGGEVPFRIDVTFADGTTAGTPAQIACTRD